MQNIVLRIKFKKSKKWLGFCYYSDKLDLIEVDERQCESEIIKTLIHEFVHFLIKKILNGSFIDKKYNVKAEVVKVKKFVQSTTDNIDEAEEELCNDIQDYASKRIHEFLLKHK